MESLPRFLVGEVVILQSVNRPELNGEDTVIGVYVNEDLFEDRFTGIYYNLNVSGSNYSYKLLNNPGMGLNEFGNVCECAWDESALRKKQEPGEMSFMQLMSSLNIEERV